jgi:hypothetical protein
LDSFSVEHSAAAVPLAAELTGGEHDGGGLQIGPSGRGFLR